MALLAGGLGTGIVGGGVLASLWAGTLAVRLSLSVADGRDGEAVAPRPPIPNTEKL